MGHCSVLHIMQVCISLLLGMNIIFASRQRLPAAFVFLDVRQVSGKNGLDNAVVTSPYCSSHLIILPYPFLADH